MRILSSLVFFLLLVNTTSFALDTNKIDDLDKWREKAFKLDWKNFEEQSEYIADIQNVNATIKIDKEDYYLNNADDIMQFSYWSWGTADNSNM